jgi:hypothetical protein
MTGDFVVRRQPNSLYLIDLYSFQPGLFEEYMIEADSGIASQSGTSLPIVRQAPCFPCTNASWKINALPAPSILVKFDNSLCQYTNFTLEIEGATAAEETTPYCVVHEDLNFR